MNTEIPDFLLEMSKQMNEQNNRMTADPLFEVRYKKSLVTESGYNESHWEILDDDGQSLYHSEKDKDYEDLAVYLFDYYNSWCNKHFDGENAPLTKNEFIELFCDDFDPDLTDLPDDVKKLSMQEIEVTVNAHFTEADAQAFIDRKQHDYQKLYIYAISLCYCNNMTKLRNWIKELKQPN